MCRTVKNCRGKFWSKHVSSAPRYFKCRLNSWGRDMRLLIPNEEFHLGFWRMGKFFEWFHWLISGKSGLVFHYVRASVTFLLLHNNKKTLIIVAGLRKFFFDKPKFVSKKVTVPCQQWALAFDHCHISLFPAFLRFFSALAFIFSFLFAHSAFQS